jgi:hypothetical protein
VFDLIEKISIFLAIGLLLGTAVPGVAQDAQRARDVIDAYRVWKLTDVLDLSEEDMPVFFSRVKKIGEAEAQHREAEREAVRQIDDLLRGGAGEGELRTALREYEEMRVAHWNEIQRLREGAASMLSLEQRCQYTVFEERFRAEIRSMIEDVRSSRGVPGQAPGGEPQGTGQRGSGKGRR